MIARTTRGVLIAISLGNVFAPLGSWAMEPLRAGLYEIRVRLELPHIDSAAATSLEKRCYGREEAPGTQPFAVLSQNNPLANCPISNVHQAGDRLTFDVACSGLNAAQGHAVYTLGSDEFRGRIEMKMGGKNMTMAEVQAGRRLGDC